MAHSLGIAVTAEGVETREQWEFLHQLGCEEMQGNYFSAPVTAEIVPGIVRQPAAAGRRASVQTLRPRRGENGADTDSSNVERDRGLAGRPRACPADRAPVALSRA